MGRWCVFAVLSPWSTSSPSNSFTAKIQLALNAAPAAVQMLQITHAQFAQKAGGFQFAHWRLHTPIAFQLSAGRKTSRLPNSSAITMSRWAMRQPCSV